MLDFRRDLTAKAKTNRKNMNRCEANLWYSVLSKKKLLNYKFTRQKPLLNYIVDFYCHKLKLIIEVDGRSHDERTDYDSKRTESLQRLGLKIIRYSNTEVMQNIEGVYFDLMNQVQRREVELNIEQPL